MAYRCIDNPHCWAISAAICRVALAASMVRIGHAVQPTINLLRDHLPDADLILGDGTVIQVLKESGRAAQSKSYLWPQMTGSGPANPVVQLHARSWGKSCTAVV